MDVLEAIRTRRSIRGFKPDPVPQAALREILTIACRAPSSMNTQPWEVIVVSGPALGELREANIAALKAGTRPDQWGPARPYEGKYRDRQVEIGVQLYRSLDIAREDAQRRAEWWQKGMRYFDAPVALILAMDKSFPEVTGAIAIGSLAQTICLTAQAYGLGTCIAVQGVMFPDVVRRVTGTPDTKRLVSSIALGYPDWGFPANQVISTRVPLEEVVTWRGFE